MKTVNVPELLRKDSLAWIGDVPNKWKYWRLKDVTYLSPSFSSKKPLEFDECTLLPMEKVSEKGSYDTELLQPFIDISSGLNLIETGDVIIAKITPCMENGKGAFIETLPTKYAFGSTEFHVFRPNSKIMARFLYYYTWNPIFRKYAEVNMIGAAGQKRISSRFIKHTKIFLPQLFEQKLISAYLDKTTSIIDKAVFVKKKQLEKLEELKKSIIHKAVTKGLDDSVEMKDSGIEWIGEIPKGWVVKKLKYYIEIKDGTHDTPTYEETSVGNYPFVTSKDITNNEIDFSAVKYINSDYHDNYYKRSNVMKDDIIMPMIGTIGNSAIVKKEEPFSIKNVALFKTSKNEFTSTKYLFYFLESELNKTQFQIISKGGVQEFVSLTILRNLYFLKPKIKEQKLIVAYLDQKTSEIDSVFEKITLQIEKLEDYKKSLIHECVTGKRRITETDILEAV